MTTGPSANTANATVQSTEVGTAYLVKSTITVTDLASITGSGDTNYNSVSITAANSNTNLSLAGLVDGSYKLYVVDAAGNLSAAASTTYTVTSPGAGDPVIDLGASGKLIAPVQVSGKWFYHWDRSGDGTSADTGSLNGGYDYTTSTVLSSIFNQTFAQLGTGNTTAGGTSDTVRFATLNGVYVALPTQGSTTLVATPPVSPNYGTSAPGTSISLNTTTANPTYTDLLSIWDSFNGTGVGTGTSGLPTNWRGNAYWASTVTSLGHTLVTLYDGRAIDADNASNQYVAVQVLDRVAPVFTSAATASVAENTATSVVVYDAQASDNQGANVTDNLVTYTLSGTDAARFTINAANGQVKFAAVPDFEAPLAAGGGNVYNINVIATDVDNNIATQAVAITVTDVALAPVVIDLNRDSAISYSHVVMDVNGDGVMDSTAWAGAQDGVLVWDKFADGQVHNSSQYAFTQYGGNTDLQGLAAAFDTDRDGKFNAQDAKFGEFMVWQDANQNGVSDAGEMHTLAALGLTEIKLTSDKVLRTPADGVTEYGQTTATAADGTQVLVADVGFEYTSLGYSMSTDKVDLDADPAANALALNLQDVLDFDSHVMVIKAGTNDVVNLDETGWSNSGTTTVDNHTYALWNNGSAQLLIDQNAQVHQVL